MKVTIEPTPELYQAPINGVKVPVRVWRGVDDRGNPMDVYVLSIVPDDGVDLEQFRAGLPDFMVPSRQLYEIDLSIDATKP
jgi:hypothetical protein